jgi:hypothetical protein
MNGLSENATKALTAQESAQVFLFILRLYVNSESIFSCVNNTQPVVSNGVVYNPVSFSLALPSQGVDGGTQSCKLSIDNVDRRIMEEVTKALGKTITADISIILASTPDVIERGPINVILRDVTADKSTVEANLYDFYLYDRNIPEGRYTPEDFPGLF